MTQQQNPRTLRALLPSAGWKDGRWTWHHFVAEREVPAEKLKYSNAARTQRPGVALIYRCEQTGAERVWGLE